MPLNWPILCSLGQSRLLIGLSFYKRRGCRALATVVQTSFQELLTGWMQVPSGQGPRSHWWMIEN